jgi:hypothetical protein
MADGKIHIVYVTSSSFKRKENEAFVEYCTLGDGTLVCDKFEFEIRAVPIKEILEVKIETMVMEEVTKATVSLKFHVLWSMPDWFLKDTTRTPGVLPNQCGIL